MNDKNIIAFIREHFNEHDFKFAMEANGLSKLDSHWTEQLANICDELESRKSPLLDQWNQLAQSNIPINEYEKLGDSPLEIIQECVDRENPLLPHPALLVLISRQFFRYTLSGGDISLEEAFFGSSKGKGKYAIRDRSVLFPRFHHLVENKKPKSLSQEKYLEELIETDDMKLGSFSLIKPDGIESFLRKYRHWKNRNDPDK